MRKYFIRMMTGEELIIEADRMDIQKENVVFYVDPVRTEGCCGREEFCVDDLYSNCVGIINNYDYCCTVKEAT